MAARHGTDTSQSARRTLGAGVGAITFAAGVFLTSVLQEGLDEPLSVMFQGSTAQAAQATSMLPLYTSKPSTMQVASWVYHRAHLTSVDATFTVKETTLSFDFVLDPSGIVQFLPAVLLGIAGYLIASRVDTRTPKDAAKAGAHAAVGYLVAAVASLYLLSADSQGAVRIGGAQSDITVDGALSVGPKLGPTIALTGLAFPLVFGALGGYLAHEDQPTQHTRDSETPPERPETPAPPEE